MPRTTLFALLAACGDSSGSDALTEATLADLVERVDELEAASEQQEVALAELIAERDALLVRLEALENAGYATTAWVEEQGYSTDGVSGLSKYVQVNEQDRAVVFTGANVYILSGSGTTDGGGNGNGYGNLILGYNEDESDGCLWDAGGGATSVIRTGSHNLVLGTCNSYTGHSSIVGGRGSTASAAHNLAWGTYTAAEADHAVALGGAWNSATAEGSVVSGGFSNTASGEYASISGGIFNGASGAASAIAGGYGNAASGTHAAIAGGASNAATADAAFVAGGHGNRASGTYAAVSGGEDNEAAALASTVAGGQGQTADEDYECLP